MTALEALLVLATGFGAGILSSTVGVASLLSFPVLVALGLPPVVANVSNTLGLIPAGLGGVVRLPREAARGAVAAAVIVRLRVGAVVGRPAARPATRGLRGDRPLPDPLHLPAGGASRGSRWLRRRHEARRAPPSARHDVAGDDVLRHLTGV